MLSVKIFTLFFFVFHWKYSTCLPVSGSGSSGYLTQATIKTGTEIVATKKPILTYEDLPEDGSRDEEFEKMQGEKLQGT